MNDYSVAIFLPIYKPVLTAAENLSFRQLLKVLGKYPVYVFYPEEMAITNYQAIAADYPQVTIRYQSRPAHFFQNTASYSEMLKDLAFYRFFAAEGYEYLLIYQLDAYVFRDELQYWVEQGYDYIGAPWFSNYTRATPQDSIVGAGNGGFSLRRISTAIRLLKQWHRFKNRYKLLGNIIRKDRAFYLTKWSMGIRTKEDISVILLDGVTEDCFWTGYLSKAFPFNIAPPEKAMYFSFEANPSVLYQMTGNRLPFGCHAWERYEPEFWQQFIR